MFDASKCGRKNKMQFCYSFWTDFCILNNDDHLRIENERKREIEKERAGLACLSVLSRLFFFI